VPTITPKDLCEVVATFQKCQEVKELLGQRDYCQGWIHRLKKGDEKPEETYALKQDMHHAMNRHLNASEDTLDFTFDWAVCSGRWLLGP
jgi:hypothetical protein